MVIWNLGVNFSSQQSSGLQVLIVAFANGAILPGATATQFHLKKTGDPELVTFKGNFVVNGGVVQSGTITGFDAYYDNATNHLIAASGHSIDFAAFSQALANFKLNNQLPLIHLVFDEPRTVNGADYQFQLEAVPGGFAADRLYGNKGNDHIADIGGDDLIFGGDGDDHVDGDSPELGGIDGKDSIFGDDGDDTLNGWGSDDFLSGGMGKDEIDGGAGSDTADYAEKSDALKVVLAGPNPVDAMIAGFVEDTVTNVENINGGLGNDRITGDGFMNRLVGNEGGDRLSGKDGDDALFGMSGQDRLNGGKDEDLLNGGAKHDVLKGGPDKDTFLFDIQPKASHSDKFVDFGGKDLIALEADVFTEVNDSGKLKAKFFATGDEAKDGNDHVLYADGALRYDRDGAGGAKAVLLAKLKGAPEVDAGDFIVA